MSTFVFNEEKKKFQFFDEYLDEAFKPKPVAFGTDLKNGRWIEYIQNNWATFFKDGDYIYMVIIETGNRGEIGFAPIDKEAWPGEVTSQNIMDIGSNAADFVGRTRRRGTGTGLKVFNQVFYIITDFVQNHNLNLITFTAMDPILGNIYRKLMSNKVMIKYLSRLGFEPYDTGHENLYAFKRMY